MKHSESVANIAAALIEVHKKLDPLIENAKNPFYKSKYVTLDAMTEYVRPILAEHGIVAVQGGASNDMDRTVTQSMVWNDKSRDVQPKQQAHESITIETMLVHTSGEWIKGSYTVPLGDELNPQKAGGAITYARRYGLGSILCLTTDEDDDGNASSGRGQQPYNASKTSRNAPQSRPAASKGGSVAYDTQRPEKLDASDPVVTYNDTFEDMVDEMNVRDTEKEPVARASIKAEWMKLAKEHAVEAHPGKIPEGTFGTMIAQWRVAVFSGVKK